MAKELFASVAEAMMLTLPKRAPEKPAGHLCKECPEHMAKASCC